MAGRSALDYIARCNLTMLQPRMKGSFGFIDDVDAEVQGVLDEQREHAKLHVDQWESWNSQQRADAIAFKAAKSSDPAQANDAEDAPAPLSDVLTGAKMQRLADEGKQVHKLKMPGFLKISAALNRKKEAAREASGEDKLALAPLRAPKLTRKELREHADGQRAASKRPGTPGPGNGSHKAGVRTDACGAKQLQEHMRKLLAEESLRTPGLYDRQGSMDGEIFDDIRASRRRSPSDDRDAFRTRDRSRDRSYSRERRERRLLDPDAPRVKGVAEAAGAHWNDITKKARAAKGLDPLTGKKIKVKKDKLKKKADSPSSSSISSLSSSSSSSHSSKKRRKKEKKKLKKAKKAAEKAEAEGTVAETEAEKKARIERIRQRRLAAKGEGGASAAPKIGVRKKGKGKGKGKGKAKSKAKAKAKASTSAAAPELGAVADDVAPPADEKPEGEDQDSEAARLERIKKRQERAAAAADGQKQAMAAAARSKAESEEERLKKRRDELKRLLAEEPQPPADETEEQRLERIKRKRQLLKQAQDAAQEQASSASQPSSSSVRRPDTQPGLGADPNASQAETKEPEDRLERIRMKKMMRKAEGSQAPPDAAEAAAEETADERIQRIRRARELKKAAGGNSVPAESSAPFANQELAEKPAADAASASGSDLEVTSVIQAVKEKKKKKKDKKEKKSKDTAAD